MLVDLSKVSFLYLINILSLPWSYVQFTHDSTTIRISYIIGNVFMFQTVAGGAINDVAANADDGDAVQYSANAPITGYSIRYQQSPCTGATQS